MWKQDFKWFFEPGATNGFNDAGITEFKSIKYDGLAREIIQNSLDAKNLNCDEPVKVVFEQQSYNSDLFPGLDNFSQAIDDCIDFYKDESANRANKSLNKMNYCVELTKRNGKFNVMKISDYNTVGLAGSRGEKGTPWHNLIRVSGNSNKEGGAGGSFGVGKYAPFTFSNLRAIVYSTKDLEGNIAVQGKTILAGHISNSTKRSPIGFFGVDSTYSINEKEYEDSAPITNPDDIPDEYLRREVGTSIYILHAETGYEWVGEVRDAVINSFFYAIYYNKLEVEIVSGENRIVINKDTLFECAKDSTRENNNKSNLLTSEYLKIFKNWDKRKTFTKTFEVTLPGELPNTGEMELIVYVDKNIEAKSIAYIRKTGMKIADASFRSMAGYVGILRTVNDTMNSFLRECEAPKHDSWSENNFGDTEGEYKHAKFILKEIESWERQIIKELNDIDDSKKIDPLGMEEFLPSDVDDNLEGEKQNEGNSFKPLDVEIKLRKDSKRTFVDQTSEGLVSDNEGEEEIEGSYGNNEGNNGNGSGDGGYNLPATPGVNSQEKKRVPIKYIKTPYLNEDGKYRVIFTPLETHEDCELKIRRAGDDIMENVKIEKMFLIKNDLIEEKNKFDIIAGQKIELEVHLKDIKREALEVGCVVKK